MKIAIPSIAKALVASALFGSFALVVHATPTLQLQPGNITENPQLQGGEFTATNSGLSTASYASSALGTTYSGFETFCMAYDQEFSYGQTLTYVLSNHTEDNSSGTHTYLTSGVAWLYSQFAKGAVGFGIADGTANTAFQLAIWTLQNSNGAPHITDPLFLGNSTLLSDYNTFMAAANAHGGSGSAATDGFGNYGVQILLTGYGTYSSSTDTFSGGYSQPQLYYSVPDDASTVALLGLALLGFAGFRSKFRFAGLR